MNEFRKVSCVYHPEEYITNFCKDKNCLMPLCPSCIGSHTEYHDKKGFKANYMNVFEALAEAQTLIYDCLINLEQDKKRNDEVMYQIHNLPLLVHEKIVLAKNMAYNALQKAFQQLEKEVMQQMDKRHEEAGIFSISRSQKHQAEIIEGIADLYEMTQNLKNDRCLAAMIKFYTESQAEVTALHGSVSSALFVNEGYTPNIEISEEAITNMAAIVTRFVNVNYSFPNTIDATSKESTKVGQVSQFKRVPTVPALTIKSTTPQKVRFGNPTTIESSPVHQKTEYIKISQGAETVPPRQLNSILTNTSQVKKTPIKTYGDVSTSPKKYNYLASNTYDEEFETLSRKVKEMRKENEMLSKALKNF